GNVCPIFLQRGPPIDVSNPTVTYIYDLSRGPIIRSKNENRVVPFTGFFDVIDDPSDVLIQYIDHGCINLHPADLVPSDRIRKSFPIIVAGLRPGIPVVQ